LQGALKVDQILFTSGEYKTLSQIDSFDEDFYNERAGFNFISTMKSFRFFGLPVVPVSFKWGEDSWSVWRQYHFIRSFFTSK